MPLHRTCPICYSEVVNLPDHLMSVHHIVDDEERKLRLSLDHGRYSGALPCHQGKCTGEYKKRLDVHLAEKHIDLTEDQRKELLAKEKMSEIHLRLKRLEEKKREENSIRSEFETVKRMVSDLQGQLTGAMNSGTRGAYVPHTRSPQKTSGRDQMCGEPRDLPSSSESQHNKQGRMTIETLTQHWMNSRLHSNASKKKVENCKQGVKHVMEYIKAMWGSEESKPTVALTYIDDPVKIKGWLKHLRSMFAIPTIKSRVYHVRVFLQYVRDQAFNGVRLGSRRFRFLLEVLKKEQDALESEVLGHRQRKTLEKASLLLSRSQLDKFRSEAKCKIPHSLDKLMKRPSDAVALKCFIGWLAGYVFSISGHRKGVLTHMTHEEAMNPRQEEDVVVINVAAHKTSSTFGQAGIVLKKTEYDWFLRFDKVRKKIPGYHTQVTRTRYFFFNSAGGEMEKLGETVAMVFDSIQMHNVTTTVIRASLATLAHRELSKEQRDLVCSSMCHGVETSTKWYVVPPSIKEAFTTRMYLEYGARGTDTEVPGPSGEASCRKAVEKKRSVVSGARGTDTEVSGASGEASSRKAVEQKRSVVSGARGTATEIPGASGEASSRKAVEKKRSVVSGARGTATEIPGASGEASSRKAVEKKRSVASGHEDEEAGDAVEDSYALEVIEKKCLEAFSSDEEDAMWDAVEESYERELSEDEEEELCGAYEVSAGEREGVSNSEMHQLCIDNSRPCTVLPTRYNFRGPMEKRKCMCCTED